MLGLPSKQTLLQISNQLSQNTIDLVHNLDDIPARKIADILPYKDYAEQDIKLAADLIGKMLKWIPSERISCEDALKHDFFHTK